MLYAPPSEYIPQITVDRRPLVMWLIVIAGSMAIMLLVIGAPLALNWGHPVFGLTIHRAFGYVCHQMPDRSFFIGQHQFAVCARCTGLYAGFACAALNYPLVRSLRQTDAPPRKWLLIAAIPLVVDFTLGFLEIWDNTHFSRFATGALLGSAAVFYVMPGLLDLSLRVWRSTSRTSDAVPHRDLKANPFSPHSSAPSDYSAPHRRI
ncbi:MAG: DUF2085 domain-containing protein [Pyrinomonadaceae bacterium]